MREYYPDYQPKDAEKFAAMEKMFGQAESPKQLDSVVLMYTLDMSYDRQDIMVAWGRVERAKGWKP